PYPFPPTPCFASRTRRQKVDDDAPRGRPARAALPARPRRAVRRAASPHVRVVARSAVLLRRCRPRVEPRQLSPGPGAALPRDPGPQLGPRPGHDAAVPPPRVSRGLLARPEGAGAGAERAPRARHPSLLDELPRAHVRLDLHAPHRGPGEHGPGPGRPRPAQPSLYRRRRPPRPGVRRAAVHDPPPLRLPREARPVAPGGRGRPRRGTRPRPVARYAAAQPARDR